MGEATEQQREVRMADRGGQGEAGGRVGGRGGREGGREGEGGG